MQHHSGKLELRKGIPWTYLPASQTPPSIAKTLIDILPVSWCARIPSWTLIRISPISRQPSSTPPARAPRFSWPFAGRASDAKPKGASETHRLCYAPRGRRESPTWWRGSRREEEGGGPTVAMFAGAQRSPALETRSLLLPQAVISLSAALLTAAFSLLFSCWRRLSSPGRWDVGARPVRADGRAASTRNLFLSLSRLLPLGNGLNGPRCEHCGIDIPSRPPVAVPGPPWR